MEVLFKFKELRNLIKVDLLTGVVPVIWGPPGVGKTSLAMEVARDLGIEGIYKLDAPLFMPWDYCIPIPRHETKSIELYRAGFLPEKGPALIVVDDLAHAAQMQQYVLMQLTLEKRVGNLRLGDDVYIVITCNREEDLAGANPLLSTVLNRCTHYSLSPDFDEWAQWGIMSGEIHPDIISFLRGNVELFSTLPVEGVRAFPTPRSWHIASKKLKRLPLEDESLLRGHLTSSVGEVAATKFMAWWRYIKEVDPVKILQEGTPGEFSKDRVFATVNVVAKFLIKENNFKKFPKETVKFFQDLPGELKIVFLKELSLLDEKVLSEIIKIDANVFSKYIFDIMTEE